MTKAEFLNEKLDLINFLSTPIEGPLKDARSWSAFGQLFMAASEQEWWSAFIADSMLELSKVSELLVKQKVSDFIKYIVNPYLFALRLHEYLLKHVSSVLAPEGIIKPSNN